MWFKPQFQQQRINTTGVTYKKISPPAAAAKPGTYQTESVAAVVRAMM